MNGECRMDSGQVKKGYLFETFVTSVLHQIAVKKNQEIIFESQILDDPTLVNADNVLFDALAPAGFDDIEGPVVFEFKVSQQIVTYNKLQSILNSIYKRIMQLTFPSVTVILLFDAKFDSSISDKRDEIVKIPNKSNVNLKIWGKDVINSWINQYPIDYSNALKHDITSYLKERSGEITKEDVNAKSQNNLAAIRKIIEKKGNFAFVLGAGVSADPGAKSWVDLLNFFKKELKKQGIIDNEDKLSKKIGASNIITAQLCKELYPNEVDYYWNIHQGLYRDRKPIDSCFALYHIASIARLCVEKAHFRILTYNFDDYLESYLQHVNVQFNILFDSKSDINDLLSIYHVHGYLPEVKYKSHIKSRNRKSIYLTEEDYNALYNHPYSWQISSQLSFFRENICLFVGCSLSDPNIRRLLEMTKKENRTHYAILTTDGMSTNDLIKASNHFARIGIEVIWVESYAEISQKLRSLY